MKDEFGIIHEPYGYETYVSSGLCQVLRYTSTTTARFIRFIPDYILFCQKCYVKEPVILLEYKVLTTPKWILGEKSCFIGQIEADAWENYIMLRKMGVLVALLIFCPYHPRPIICDFPDKSFQKSKRLKVKGKNIYGSGTDYYNISLCRFRLFSSFLEDEFSIPSNISRKLLRNVLCELRKDPMFGVGK